jgi:hypothetical protein
MQPYAHCDTPRPGTLLLHAAGAVTEAVQARLRTCAHRLCHLPRL